MAETKLTKKEFIEVLEQPGVYENQFIYIPSEKKGPNFLGSKGPIFKLPGCNLCFYQIEIGGLTCPSRV